MARPMRSGGFRRDLPQTLAAKTNLEKGNGIMVATLDVMRTAGAFRIGKGDL